MTRYLATLLLLGGTASAQTWPIATVWKPAASDSSRQDGYDERGRLVEIRRADGTVIRFDYQADGRLLRKLDETGRVSSFSYDERGNRTMRTTGDVEYRYVNDRAGGPVATLVGVHGEDFTSLLSRFGVLGRHAAPPQFESKGDQTTAAKNAVASLSWEYSNDPGYLKERLVVGGWSTWTERAPRPDGWQRITVPGGRFFEYRMTDDRTVRFEDERGVIMERTLDSLGRLSRIRVAGDVLVTYKYQGNETFWTAKSVTDLAGDLARTVHRLDLLRRPIDGRPRAILRGPTRDRVVEVVEGALSYVAHLAGQPVARYSGEGVLQHMILSPYGAEDEVRLMPDGSVELLVSSPGVSTELESETGPVFRVSVSRGTTSSRHALVMVGEMCDWVPGGWVDAGGTSWYTEGYWECSFISGGGGGDPGCGGCPPPPGGGGSVGGTPVTPQQQFKLNEAIPVARERVLLPACQALFSQHGANGDPTAILNGTTYRNGITTTGAGAKCASNPAASTSVGSYVVYLCSPFTDLSGDLAAARLIHEALHTAGQNENPPDGNAMSSQAINQMVNAACNLQ